MEKQPSPISKAAKARILAFARGVEALQRKYGVSLCVQDATLAFRDRRDKKPRVDWEWDAHIFDGTQHERFKASNVVFETFDWWGK